jgi:hypothetical protein
MAGWRASLFAALLVLLARRPVAAQAARSGNEVDLSRVFSAVPTAFERVAARGYAELFRLLENVELLRIESEIDRYVGKPRALHDSTQYKLSLLPYHIRYPIFRPLVDQMTRLDSVRSRRIYMVTPDSVTLVDLRIAPVLTLETFNGLGAGPEIQSSLLNHFSAREIADMSVFLLAQQPFFPETQADWDRTKRQIARAGIPIAIGALTTGAVFDAGALGHSGKIAERRDAWQLRYYGNFRGLGISLRPHLRAGLALEAFKLQASAGLADQVRPNSFEPDAAVEMALREGWLSQWGRMAGWDGFFEAAFRRSIKESAGFAGERARGRAGFFFKREQMPLLPSLTLRGSAEAETNFEERLHLVGALGFERPASGLTTVLQGSLVPAPRASNLPDDARLNLFVVGTMEPISSSYVEDMNGLAHTAEEEWAGLLGLDRRREDWEKALLARGVANRTPEETRSMLAEMEQMLVEGEARLARLASVLADYVESRRRAYGIMNRPRSPDELHGPLDGTLLLAARGRILSRLSALSDELGTTLGNLESLRGRIALLKREITRLESTEPAGSLVVARRRELAWLEREWDVEAERARHQLSARDQLHAEGRRILAATGRDEKSIRDWDTLGALVRMRLARLAITAPP